MAEIANSITDLFNSSQEDLMSLQNIIESQHSGMQDIADSMESTAQSITKQAEKVQQIQEQTDSTEKHRIEMTTASDSTQMPSPRVYVSLKILRLNQEMYPLPAR